MDVEIVMMMMVVCLFHREIGIDLAVHLVELLIRLFENGADEDETQTEVLLVVSLFTFLSLF